MKIQIKKYVMDESLSWEDRYKRLEAHHKEETEYLIAKHKEDTEYLIVKLTQVMDFVDNSLNEIGARNFIEGLKEIK